MSATAAYCHYFIPDSYTVAFVKVAIKLVTAFGNVISQCVPCIYLAVLPFAVTPEASKAFCAFSGNTVDCNM